MESFGVLEGRGRPAVVMVEGEESSDERVEVKAWLVEAVMGVSFVVLGRGWPYRDDLDGIVWKWKTSN